jgi:hypothetical protein
MPGAGVTGPIGLAAGAGAAASVGVNVASAGVKRIRSSMAYLSDQTAKQIILQANSYFSQQGWKLTALNSKPRVRGVENRVADNTLALKSCCLFKRFRFHPLAYSRFSNSAMVSVE